MLRVSNRLRVLLVAGVVVAAVGMLLPQVTAAPGPFVSNINPYLRVLMGQSGVASVTEPAPADDAPRAGRWGLWTIKGDPESTLDDNIPVIQTALDGGPGGQFGYSTLRIDDKSFIYGDPAGGQWILMPQPSDRNGSDYVGSPIGLTGFYILSQYKTSGTNIFAQFRLVLIRDQMRLEMMIRNDDTLDHTIGLRHCADSTTNGNADSGSSPFIPGRGVVRAETDTTTGIPAYFEIYDDPSNPQVAIRNSLSLQDATPPDRMAVASWTSLQTDPWLFTPSAVGTPADWGWALWWNPVTLRPGQSKTIITYFGMAAASSAWTSDTGSGQMRQNPWCLSVQGPRALSINYDATKTAEEMLSPNPFTVKAYVYNLLRDQSLNNVSVYLSLPPGLELVSGDPSQTVISIAPETEAPAFSWQVRATGEVSGELKYRVVASGSPQFSQSVERTIVVPATSTTSFKVGPQMISIPFQFTDPRIESALGFTPDTYRAVRWDAAQGNYVDATITSPGTAFWFISSVARDPATLATDARPLSGTEAKRISLVEGWNQFGNPFLFCVPWGNVKVFTIPQEPEITIQDAVTRGILRGTIYWYDTSINDYLYSSDPETQLLPWQGYWIKALQPCQLVIPPINQVGGTISGDTRARKTARAAATSVAPGGNGWRLQLVAKAGSASDSRGILGVDSRAAALYDSMDVERPPLLENYVAISFPHKDWGTNNGNYMTDIRRSAGGSETWEFTVASDQQNTDVVLTWPALQDVPKAYALRLMDVDGNVTKYLRSTSAYKYNSGSGGARRFKIVAEPAQSGGPLITGISVGKSRAVGGATLSFNLSSDATTEVIVKSLSGSVVRKLAQGKAVTRGINSLAWNGRNDGGIAVPGGVYQVEIVATTPDGQVARAIHPFLVSQ